MPSPYHYYNGYDKLYKDGMYRGRFAIEDDTPIIGGVSYGEHRGEAVVVNPEGTPKYYQDWYQESIARASLHGVIRREKVLRGVYDTVDARMRYSKDGVDDIVQDRMGKKIDLGVFMKAGVGVCRHQALACAALLEFHKDDRHIRGTPRVNRNIRVRKGAEPEGHAWARYNSHDGSIMILDVAQWYFGTLEASRNRGTRFWGEYRTDADKRAGL